MGRPEIWPAFVLRNYRDGRRASMIFFASLPSEIPLVRRFRFRLEDFPLSRWPRKALRCLALPDAVILKRRFIPLWVFCLGMDLSSGDRCANVNLLETMKRGSIAFPEFESPVFSPATAKIQGLRAVVRREWRPDRTAAAGCSSRISAQCCRNSILRQISVRIRRGRNWGLRDSVPAPESGNSVSAHDCLDHRPAVRVLRVPEIKISRRCIRIHDGRRDAL